jgi:hypothetical protein
MPIDMTMRDTNPETKVVSLLKNLCFREMCSILMI